MWRRSTQTGSREELRMSERRCARCRGWHSVARQCKAGRNGPATECEIFREVMSYSDTMDWLKRREALESRGNRAGVSCWHTVIVEDGFSGDPMETMTIWNEREGKSIVVTEDSGADRGLQIAEQFIEYMIIDGNTKRPAPRIPRGRLKPPEERIR
jgi:hypothetical protein